MRLIIPIATMLVLAPALAGCMTHANVDVADASTDLAPEEILPYWDMTDAHDHTNPDQHRASWNVEVLGWNAFTDDGVLGRYNHVWVHGDYAYASAYKVPPTMEPGIAILDLTDRANPEVVSTWTSEFTTPIDIQVTPDGQYALVGGHRDYDYERTAPSAVPCTSAPAPGGAAAVCQPFVPGGIELLDVSDPANPTLVAQWTSAPSGAHTAKIQEIGGELYAFIATYGFSYADRMASHVEILKVNPAFPGGFEPVSKFFPSEPSRGRTFVHDMWLEEHPITGDMLMYVSYWNGGVPIVDVSDPSSPEEIAVWKDFDPAVYGNIHFARPMPYTIGDKHYTVAAPEFGSAEHAGETYFLDTTDPTDPKLVGKWTMPGDPVSPYGYMHSPHNFHFREDGIMVMSHFHGGIWVLDLNPLFEGEPVPKEVGYAFPAPPSGLDLTMEEDAMTPSIWHTVWMDDGEHLVASCMYTGVYTMKWTEPEADAVPPYAHLV